MMDELDALKAALKSAPLADAGKRAKALGHAMQTFDRLQETGGETRSTSDRPVAAGYWSKARNMMSKLSSRPLLAATTPVAAICLGLIVILPQIENRYARPTAPEPILTAPFPALAAKTASSLQDGPAADEAGSAAQAFMPNGVATRTLVLPPTPQVGHAPQTTETYASAASNPVKVAAEEPVSTFSVDVDTASYSIVRSMLNSGQVPSRDAVRVEEFVNYFPYAYPAPDVDGGPFSTNVAVMPTPWNPQTRLVRIGLQGAMPSLADRPPLNLIFLIDTSGSMDEPNKLPLLKQSLRLMLPLLDPRDQVAIVTYAGAADEVLPPTLAGDTAAINAALDNLSAGRGTAGAEGLTLAYHLADGMAETGEVSRILLATDGDFNLGISDPEALKTLIAEKRENGTYLSVLGFGRGNLDDATMQALAQNGNGTAAYIDTMSEARKVLVDQLTGALFPIADDVKIQIEWNPAQVAEYRLIGYETRALQREDFNSDAVDSGEIGAGHQVTALYEITAPGSPALRNDPLRYGAKPVPQIGGELGFLRLRYKKPGETVSNLIETPILPETTFGDDDARFAAAIAGFGQLLAGSVYLNGWNLDQAIAMADGAQGPDPFGYRAEAVNLMRLAQAMTR